MNDTEKRIIHLLKLAQTAFLSGNAEDADARMRHAGDLIERLGKPNTLLGEWTLTSCMYHLFDIDALLNEMRRAKYLLGSKRSISVDIDELLSNFSDSLLVMFYGRGVSLDEILKKSHELTDLSMQLSGGGATCALQIEAEAAYYRADLSAAAINAHRAVYVAQNYGKSSIIAPSAKVIAQVAKHRMDMDAWNYAARLMEEAQNKNGKHHAIKNVRYELLTEMQSYDALPQWLREGRLGLRPGNGVLGFKYKLENSPVRYFAVPNVLWTHEMYLLSTSQFDRLLAMDSMQHSMNIDATMPGYGAYYTQARALCYLAQGNREAAKRELATVVEAAAKDRMWMLIAEYEPYSDGIVMELLRERSCEGCKIVEEINGGERKTAKAVTINETAVDVALSVLTRREKEIAKYAAEGMNNKEIAEKLNITVQTVKFHLGNVFKKLMIKNRSKLAKSLRSMKNTL